MKISASRVVALDENCFRARCLKSRYHEYGIFFNGPVSEKLEVTTSYFYGRSSFNWQIHITGQVQLEIIDISFVILLVVHLSVNVPHLNVSKV